MRSFQAGGTLMTSLFDQMRADVESYLEVGIEAGTLRRPRDVSATANYLAVQNGGGFFFFLQLYAARHEGKLDFRKALREYADQMMLPAVEANTHGLFADSSVLDSLLAEM